MNRTLTRIALPAVLVAASTATAATTTAVQAADAYRVVPGAATTSTDQMATLQYWLGPNLNDDSKLERPFGTASYTPDADKVNGTSYASHVPNERENVPDQGDAGRLWPGGGTVATSVGKLFYIESGTRAATSSDVAGDYNYLGQKLPVTASPTDPWIATTGFTRVINGDGTVTDSWTGVCSADAVFSANSDTILSAGHCVEAPSVLAKNGNPAYDSVQMSRWIFVPGFTGITSHDASGTDTSLAQAAPYGVWVATHVYTTPYWDDWVHGLNGRDSGSYDLNALAYDFSAMTVVNPLRPGVTLDSVAGAQAVAFNVPTGGNVTSFGYPQGPDTLDGQYYGGRSLATCTGSSFGDIAGTGNSGPGGVPGLQDIGVWCHLTEGASGGPVFGQFDRATGQGYQISVNSFKEPLGSSGLYLMGPQFGDVIHAVFTAISSTTP